MGLRRILVLPLLASALSACASTRKTPAWTPDRLGASPCAKVHRDAHDACVSVADRCASSVRRCLRALPDLADPLPYGPSAEPCDVAILGTLANIGPEHVPELLASIASDDRHAWHLLSLTLPRTSEALELALEATPGEAATIALGMIAASKDRKGAAARLRARPEAYRVMRKAWNEHGVLGPLLVEPRREYPRSTAQLVADAYALRADDDAWTVCSATGSDVNRGHPWLAREAFARIANQTTSERARKCALFGTTSPEPELSEGGWDSEFYGHRARRQPLARPGCVPGPELSPTRPWSFRRLGKDRSRAAVSHAGWRTWVTGSPFGRRPNRRDFVCFEMPTPEAAPMGAGRLGMQDGRAVFVQDGAMWQVAHMPIALHVLDARYAFVIEPSIIGDDLLMEHQIVSLWDADARHLEELVGLRGESYHWSFVDDDGALVVATSSGGRFVSAIHRSGQIEDVTCW